MKTHAEQQKDFDKRALSIREAAEYACVSRGTIDSWLVKGLLPFEELPSKGKGKYCFRRIRKTDLDVFLDTLRSNVQPKSSPKQTHYKELILLPRDA
jgi:excisionase family DNA binding protein